MAVEKNPVGWFEIYVEDMQRAKKFYESVFQVSLTKIAGADLGNSDIEIWTFPMEMTQYGACGALVKRSGTVAKGNSLMIYFSCDDCAIEEDRIEPNGGKIERKKFSIGEHGFITLFVDTEGNTIGLHSH